MKLLTNKFTALMLALFLTGSFSMAQTTVTEDFESGDFSNLNWQFEGTPNSWEIENVSLNGGSYSASANAVAFNDYVFMTVTRTFAEPGVVSFDVQQTENSVFIFEIGESYSMFSPGWIVGTDLRQEVYAVPEGTHEIRFGSYTVGNWGQPFSMTDSLFIDNIQFTNQTVANEAYVQLIHNAADPLAEVVDVYVNGEMAFDNFAFRTASPFISLPAEEAFTVEVKGPESTPSDDALWSNEYTLESGERYILIAEGMVGNANDYTPYQEFGLDVLPAARQSSSDYEQVDVLVYHGSTDAPTVDIYETGVGAGLLIDDLSYGEFSSYLELPEANYQISVFDETGSNLVATYYAPLADFDLNSQAITVLASGFLNPEANSSGESFGLYAALPQGGELIMLAIMSDLEGQVEDFETGDFSQFNWRFEGEGAPEAWSFVEASSGNGTYSVTAEHTAFVQYESMYVTGEFVNEGYLIVDAYLTDNASLIIEAGDNGIYEFFQYTGWETITLEIPTGVQEIKFTSYVAGVFGAPFIPDQDSVMIGRIQFGQSLPPQSAMVQIIHNSPDVAAENVNIWANGEMLIEDLTYGESSAYISVPAETDINLEIETAGKSANSVVYSSNVSFEADQNYVVVASGLFSTDLYSPFEPFGLEVFEGSRMIATDEMNTDVLVYHGSTDAPMVSVVETGVGAGELFSFSYGEFEGYLELPTNDYILQINDMQGNPLTAFSVPLAELGLEGQALTVVASGFVTPENNNNGAAFNLMVSLPDGGELVELLPAQVTGINDDAFLNSSLDIYPNPVTDIIRIDLREEEAEIQRIFLVDMGGRIIQTVENNNSFNSKSIEMNIGEHDAGVYLLNIQTNKANIQKKIVLNK